VLDTTTNKKAELKTLPNHRVRRRPLQQQPSTEVAGGIDDMEGGARRGNVMIRHFEDQLNIAIAQRRDKGDSRDRSKSQTEVALPKQTAQLLPALLDLIYDDKFDSNPLLHLLYGILQITLTYAR